MSFFQSSPPDVIIKEAAPDLIIGLMGVPVAFSFQKIAENVEGNKLCLTPFQLYALLGILIASYFTLSLVVLGLARSTESPLPWYRYLQLAFAGVSAMVIFSLGHEVRTVQDLHRRLAFAVLTVALSPLPAMIDRVTSRRNRLYTWLFVLMVVATAILYGR